MANEQGSAADVVVRVRLETTQVEQAQKKITDGFREMGLVGKFAMSVLGATAAGLTAPIAQDLFTIGKGLTAPFGREASRALGIQGFANKIGAEQSTLEQVQGIFAPLGAEGARGSREAIRSAFKAYLALNTRQAQGEDEVANQTKDLTTSGKLMMDAQDKLTNAIYTLIQTFQKGGGWGYAFPSSGSNR